MTVDPTEHATISIEDRTVEGPHGALRVRVYRPTTTAAAGLVWAHGGAFAFGDLEMTEADGVARSLAGQGISVVSVDYQLAPPPGTVAGTGARDGARFPVASEEVTAAFVWARTHTAALGVPGGAWSLGGAGAGSHLAAGAALRLRRGPPARP